VSSLRTNHRPLSRAIGRHWAGENRSPWLAAAWTVVAAFAVVYLVYFFAHLHTSIFSLLWNSDFAGGFTLPETLIHTGSGGNTVISTTGAWADLWYGLLTAHLGFHRQLWEISPAILFAITGLVLGRGVWRVSNLACACSAVMIVFLASPWTLAIVLAPVAHNTVYPTTAVLGATMPWLLRRRLRSRLAWGAIGIVAAVVLGADIASDKLVLITAVIPLGLLSLAALLQPRREVRLVAGGTLLAIVLAIPASIATNSIMTAEGYHTTPPALKLAPLSTVGFHFRLLWHGLRDLSNGYLTSGYPGTLHVVLGVACTVVMALALVGLVAGGAPAVLALVRRRPQDDEQLQRLLHLAFWFVSVVVVMLAFVFTNAVGNGLGNHESYFLTILFSVAAVVPLLTRRIRVLRRAAPVALAVFAAGSIVGAQESYINVYRSPIASVASTIAQVARANDATIGYSGYWDASSLTWADKGAIDVRPLEQCANPNPAGAGICPFFLMRTPAWYKPEPRRSFLIVDPNQLYVTSLPSHLGKPLKSYRLGPITVYVYGYDIASKLGPFPGIAHE
jgi:hypothetical protein